MEATERTAVLVGVEEVVLTYALQLVLGAVDREVVEAAVAALRLLNL